MDMVPQDQGDRHGLSLLDRVHIKGVAAHGYHGVLAAERAQGQEFVVDATLFLETAQAAATDDLDLTVNYAHVCDALVSVVEGHAVNLIETLAERLAAIVLENKLVHGVAITVHKPRAPIAVPFTDVEVSIVRSRENMPSVARPFNEDLIAPVRSLPRWSQELPPPTVEQQLVEPLGLERSEGTEPAPREIPELEEVWAEQAATSEPVLDDQPVAQEASAPQVQPTPEEVADEEETALEFELEPEVVLAPNVALAAPIIASTELPAGVPTWAQVISTDEVVPEDSPVLSSGPIFSPVSAPNFEAEPEPEPATEPAWEPEPEVEPEAEVATELEVEPEADGHAQPEPELLQEVPFEAELEINVESDPQAEIEPEVEADLDTDPPALSDPAWDFDAQLDYSETVGNNEQTQVIPVITDDDSGPEPDLGAAPIIEPSPESLAIYQALRAQVLGTQEPDSAGNLALPTQVEPERDIMDRVPLAPARVVIALGANLGTAQETLAAAVRALGEVDGFELVKTGPLARTGAVGGPEDQPDYLNTVVIGLTTLSPRQLLAQTQKIENDHGRVRLEHWGPRTLDLDIIDFEAVVATTTDLELPHPRANQRAFVLVPWEVMDPDAYLPGLGGGPVAALAATAPDRPGIRWVALEWLEF